MEINASITTTSTSGCCRPHSVNTGTGCFPDLKTTSVRKIINAVFNFISRKIFNFNYSKTFWTLNPDKNCCRIHFKKATCNSSSKFKTQGARKPCPHWPALFVHLIQWWVRWCRVRWCRVLCSLPWWTALSWILQRWEDHGTFLTYDRPAMRVAMLQVSWFSLL